ncbi:MAG TPA: MBL fold metallo-hydrolase [Pyrinomonadaceae bacterium]|nr:MBL fold metallo-hydrolase [Pyrinomonadaceae bacterium]
MIKALLRSGLAASFCLILFISSPGAADSPRFDVQKLSEGVYAVVRREPPGLMFDANNLFIIGERDVIVVDSNFSLASTREVLAALKKLTDKPVRYVVNTHWHDDHITGNQVYRDAFPSVEFIGHESAVRDMAETGAKNRKGLQDNTPRLIKLFQGQVEKKKNLAGQDLTEEESMSYLKDAFLLERYLESIPSLQIIAPTLTVKESLTLRRGSRTVEILHIGGGHTPADLIVYLPEEGILASGDLIVHPVPLVGSTSLPIDYAATLRRLIDLKPKIIVPGHGPVMRDDSYVRRMIRLLDSINSQTEAAVRRGETLEQARKSVQLEELRREFAGASQLKSFIFQTYVVSPGIEAAYKQAQAK